MNRSNLDKIYFDLCDKEKRDLILAKAKFIEKYECFTKLADAYPGWYTELVDTKALTFKNEDVLITDPGYILTDEDENIGIDNSNLEEYRKKGLTKSIIHETIYGDWDCEVKDVNTHRIIDGNINVAEHELKFAEDTTVADLTTGKEKLGKSFIGGFMMAIMTKMNLRNKMKVVLMSGYSSFGGYGNSLDIFNIHDYEEDEYEKLKNTETPSSLAKEAFEEIIKMAKNGEISYNPGTFSTDNIFDELMKPEAPILRKTETKETIMNRLGDLQAMGLLKVEFGNG